MISDGRNVCINNTFAIGDTAYIAFNKYRTTSCKVCHGTGQVEVEIIHINEKIKINCPKCNNSESITRELVAEEVTIQNWKYEAINDKLIYDVKRTNSRPFETEIVLPFCLFKTKEECEKFISTPEGDRNKVRIIEECPF